MENKAPWGIIAAIGASLSVGRGASCAAVHTTPTTAISTDSISNALFNRNSALRSLVMATPASAPTPLKSIAAVLHCSGRDPLRQSAVSPHFLPAMPAHPEPSFAGFRVPCAGPGPAATQSSLRGTALLRAAGQAARKGLRFDRLAFRDLGRLDAPSRSAAERGHPRPPNFR